MLYRCSLIVGLGILCLLISSVALASPPKSCVKVSRLKLSASNKLLSSYKNLCRDSKRAYYCQDTPAKLSCSKIDLVRSKKNWSKTPLKKVSDYKALLLSSYMDLIKFKKPLKLNSRSRFQTGPYSQITLNTKSPLRMQCLESILYSAQILQKELPQFNFEIDGKIKRCANLRQGVELMIENKAQVVRNLKQIHSPLHTIYFTTKSKYNDHILGKMGLYINVEKENEIKNRLIDFKISQLFRLR